MACGLPTSGETTKPERWVADRRDIATVGGEGSYGIVVTFRSRCLAEGYAEEKGIFIGTWRCALLSAKSQ